MATYCGYTRTNYFSVKDEAAFLKLVGEIVSDGEAASAFSQVIEGEKMWAFGMFGSIRGLRSLEADDCDDDYEPDAVYDKLRGFIVDGDAVIITEIGYENLRYLSAYTTIITKDAIECCDLREHSIATARRMLGRNDFSPRMEY